jgi:hypothetical protein
MRWSWVGWVSGLMACDGGAPEEEPCTVTFTSSVADGAQGVPGNATVRFVFSEDDAEAEIISDVPGDAAWEAPDTLAWTPFAPFDASAAASLTVRTCAGDTSIGWTTDAAGAPLDPSVALDATGWSVDLLSGTVLRPATDVALRALFALSGTELLLGVLPGGSTSSPLTFRGAVATDGEQDLCSRTLDLPGGALDRGWFSFGPSDATFGAFGVDVALQQLAFDGAFSSDGQAIAHGRFHTWVEVAALADIYADGDEGAACAFFGDLLLPCVDCPSGEGSCLELWVEGLAGSAVGAPVEQVLEACPI